MRQLKGYSLHRNNEMNSNYNVLWILGPTWPDLKLMWPSPAKPSDSLIVWYSFTWLWMPIRIINAHKLWEECLPHWSEMSRLCGSKLIGLGRPSMWTGEGWRVMENLTVTRHPNPVTCPHGKAPLVSVSVVPNDGLLGHCSSICWFTVSAKTIVDQNIICPLWDRYEPTTVLFP